MTHHDKARELVERLRGLEVCYQYAGEAADLITELAQALEYAEAKDTPDALTPLIKEATQAPGYWSIYAQALELVSNRYSKSGLVHLTAFLMMREQAQAEENRRLREALRPFASEADMWGDLVPDDHAPLCVEMGHTDGRYYGSATKYTVGDLRLARAALSSTGEKG